MKKILISLSALVLTLFVLTGCGKIKKSEYGMNKTIETTPISLEEAKTALGRITPIENESYMSIYVYGKIRGADFYGNVDVDLVNVKASASIEIGAVGGMIGVGYLKAYLANNVLKYAVSADVAGINENSEKNVEFAATEEGINSLTQKAGFEYNDDYSKLFTEQEQASFGLDKSNNLVIEFEDSNAQLFRVVVANDKVVFIGGSIDTKSDARTITFNATITYGSANVVNPL